jgi:hypothetical protein
MRCTKRLLIVQKKGNEFYKAFAHRAEDGTVVQSVCSSCRRRAMNYTKRLFIVQKKGNEFYKGFAHRAEAEEGQ